MTTTRSFTKTLTFSMLILREREPIMQRIVVTQHPGVVRWLCSTPRARTFLVAAATLLLLLSAPSATFAGSAYWLSAPATSDWNTAGNWTAGGPPNGPADTAFFFQSTRTAVSISANTQVNGIELAVLLLRLLRHHRQPPVHADHQRLRDLYWEPLSHHTEFCDYC